MHGHIDRLEALLDKADPKGQDARIIQLGDLGHFGYDTQFGDTEAWHCACKGLVDLVLWGNHDRAVVDANHKFGGYCPPAAEIKHMMRTMESEGRLQFAEEAHGWLLTHAGLHKAIEFQGVPEESMDLHDARSIADWINNQAKLDRPHPVMDAVGRERGGSSPHGGILWRDITEPLWDGVPQVFGHSASTFHVVRGDEGEWYCIDIGGKGGSSDLDANCLAGIWLPSQEIVRVDMEQL